jgi:beta-glucosidase/6-phospho-beta-glucosidase/beta-galactosidase
MTPKPEILSGLDGSKVGPLKGSTDIYDTTAHRQRYAADLGLLVQDGVQIVRVCIPYHLIDRGGYDWTWTDAYMNCMRELGLTPIVDPVHHASFPPWCIGGLSHPEFQDRYLAFMEAFVERYPWVTHFTVINEPVFTTWFCARQGIWHPRRRGDDAFVRMLNDVCKTICTISNMLIDRVPGLTLVHPDRSKKITELMKLGFCMRGFLMRSVG